MVFRMGGPVEKAEGGKVSIHISGIPVCQNVDLLQEGMFQHGSLREEICKYFCNTCTVIMLVVYRKDGPIVQAEGSKVYTCDTCKHVGVYRRDGSIKDAEG